MKNSTILIVVGKNCPEQDLAARLEEARSLSAHVAILITGMTPWNPAYDYAGSSAESRLWTEAVEAERAELTAMSERAEKMLQEHDVSGDVATKMCDRVVTAYAVARRALICDLAIVGQDLRQTPDLYREAVFGVLFRSPIGVLLNSRKDTPSLAPKRVFVAWNTGKEAARAVHLALPALRTAEEVVIATFDPVMTEYQDGENPGSDVAKWLTHHGCKVRVEQFTCGGKEIGKAILERSGENGADLVVMGAYGHSRLREAVFGGTTQSLIDQTGQAVFLAH